MRTQTAASAEVKKWVSFAMKVWHHRVLLVREGGRRQRGVDWTSQRQHGGSAGGGGSASQRQSAAGDMLRDSMETLGWHLPLTFNRADRRIVVFRVQRAASIIS